MGKKLTEEMIRDKTNIDDIEQVKDLNFWANDLEDVSILSRMPSIETISLSLNKISSLSFFRSCIKLEELFLRKNKIGSLKEIHYLKNLPCLKVLWLWDNPLSSHPHYRLYIVKVLPNLKKLDNAAVSDEERTAAKKLDLATLESEESEVAGEDTEENKRVNDSYMKSNFIKKEKIRKPPSGTSSGSHSRGLGKRSSLSQRNDNILTAVMALINELDKSSLDLIHKEIGKKISEM
ncbi:unnamed protein product [Moneuplotes crassus]|uniref:U2A'/phosphoprotein 32 family A C-terminal domain-containing protein n=1 Tax=Euplotes crassus TaxID=5936 RepID=A0AAD2D3Z6_EUPCR|nr:unnamed protein product [Moneuplotes crassus]